MAEEIEKKYYKIKEVAAMFDVNESLLRFWETKFDVIKPFKNKKGDRYYRLEDVENIRTIHYLTKVQGYTLRGAQEAMKAQASARDKAQVFATLEKLKKLLLEIKQEL